MPGTACECRITRFIWHWKDVGGRYPTIQHIVWKKYTNPPQHSLRTERIFHLYCLLLCLLVRSLCFSCLCWHTATLLGMLLQQTVHQWNNMKPRAHAILTDKMIPTNSTINISKNILRCGGFMESQTSFWDPWVKQCGRNMQTCQLSDLIKTEYKGWQTSTSFASWLHSWLDNVKE